MRCSRGAVACIPLVIGRHGHYGYSDCLSALDAYSIRSHGMKICVVGTGYVGLVVGTCLADFGHNITCVDKEQAKVDLLNSGGIPIYEPGLDDVISRCMEAGRLRFVTVLPDAVRAAEVIFIAVGTPAAADGSADLSGVLAVAKMIGQSLTDGSVAYNRRILIVETRY